MTTLFLFITVATIAGYAKMDSFAGIVPSALVLKRKYDSRLKCCFFNFFYAVNERFLKKASGEFCIETIFILDISRKSELAKDIGKNHGLLSNFRIRCCFCILLVTGAFIFSYKVEVVKKQQPFQACIGFCSWNSVEITQHR